MKVISPILFVGALGLIGLAGKATVDVIDVSPLAPAVTAVAPSAPTAAPFAMPPLSAMSETRERPLFSATRRPGPAIDSSPPEDSMRRFTLIGLMRAAGRDGRALIRADGANLATWVGVGGEIDGYVLREVSGDGVMLERGGRRIALKIRATRTAQE